MKGEKLPNGPRFESCASLLPRLDTLIIYLPFDEFNEVIPIFRNSGQLQLRSIDIGMPYSAEVPQTGINIKWFECLSTDAVYLRELTIRGLSLPWTIPPHQKLTRLLIITPYPLPTPVDLLTFLSHCLMLNELELSLCPGSRTHDLPSTSSPVALQKLNFSYLTKLGLSATDIDSHECVREVSSRIVIPGQLSSLSITYLPRINVSSTKLFELAPAGSWAHFKNQPFFSINLPLPRQPFYFPRQKFHIYAGGDPNGPLRGWKPGGNYNDNNQLTPFSLVGRPQEVFDYLPVVDLIRGMSNIQHLQLISSACELLTSWNVDFPAPFPHLITLELQYVPVKDCTDCLMALIPFPDIILNTLILRGVGINSAVLLDVASKTGMRTLGLEETHVENEIPIILRGKGVEVILIDEEWYFSCTVSEN
ncbi:hypothetical protein Clacol_004995 [Clathrus columnatus]|uniref:Uncharacterized protein n=1 Tax=Clathrus columnatus TaxID=1419009 RepID=A0AAV5AB15_9AGAM|nr:hypothetical protein Clacol_004995 [Clathrus columnatus]